MVWEAFPFNHAFGHSYSKIYHLIMCVRHICHLLSPKFSSERRVNIISIPVCQMSLEEK